MPAKQLPDKQVEMMIRQGMRPAQIVEKLLEEHHIKVTPEAISMWRKRRGIEPWVDRYQGLIPWRVAREHNQLYPVKMLRAEAARRMGKRLSETAEAELDRWIAARRDSGTVVTYERDVEPGWFYVPARACDTDLIRDPKVK